MSPRSPRPKVFGIGLNKTGTRSIAVAMRMLGYRTFHVGGDKVDALVAAADAAGEPLLTRLGAGFDAYFDVHALVVRFRELDEQYPGSTFLLTTRELDGWIESRRRHVLANQQRAAQGRYRGSWLEVDIEGWRAEYDEHHRAVRSYFSNRPQDLLELDVCSAAADPWHSLAPFLGRPVPARPFPHENRDGSGTYRPAAIGARARAHLISVRGRFRCR